MRRDVDGHAKREMLGDLETRLVAYLEECRRELGIKKWPEAGIDRKKQRPVATEREEQRR